MQPVLKELMSVKGLILLIALVALGLSITAVVGGGCGSSFAVCIDPPGTPGGCPASDRGGVCDCMGGSCRCRSNPFACYCNDGVAGSGIPGEGECCSGNDCSTVDPNNPLFCKPAQNRKDCVFRKTCQRGEPPGKDCIDEGELCRGQKKSCCDGLECLGLNCVKPEPPDVQPPPSHPPGFNPQPSPPSPSKKSGGMIGGGGSILGGSTIGGPGGTTGGFVPNPPSPSPPGPPPPGTEGGVCGKIGLGNIKCKSSDLECKKKNTFPPPPTGTCVKKSPDIPLGCAQINEPCGSGEEADCCDNYECVKQLGGATCQRKSPGPSPTGGLPEWAVYSLWSAGGVALIAIVIYLIMQMQSGKVN